MELLQKLLANNELMFKFRYNKPLLDYAAYVHSRSKVWDPSDSERFSTVSDHFNTLELLDLFHPNLFPFPGPGGHQQPKCKLPFLCTPFRDPISKCILPQRDRLEVKMDNERVSRHHGQARQPPPPPRVLEPAPKRPRTGDAPSLPLSLPLQLATMSGSQPQPSQATW